MKGKIKKILYYVSFSVIVVFSGLFILSVLPISGNIKFLIVQSASMEPAIKMGSLVLVKPDESYEVGDVISFGESSKFETPTTHRVHDIEQAGGTSYYITKGDQNNAPDRGKISERDIIGEVLVSFPYLGYLISFIKKPLGFLAIVIVPLSYIIVGEVKNIYEEVKSKKE
jgi:signal peptidase